MLHTVKTKISSKALLHDKVKFGYFLNCLYNSNPDN